MRRLLILVLVLALALAQQSPEQKLIRAIDSHDHAGIKQALAEGADPNQTVAAWGEKLPLTNAAASGDAEAVTLLLQAGAEPDVQGWKGCRGGTPLIAAAQKPEIVKLLLEAGANPGLGDCDPGALALHYAVGNPESMKLLLPQGPPIGFLGYHRMMSIAEIPLVDQVAMRGSWWVSPLLVAVWAGDSESTAILIEAGARTSSEKYHLYETDPSGMDTLMAAAGTVWDDEATGKQLLEQLTRLEGYNITLSDFWWQDNPLTYALEAGRVEWAEDLVERGFDPAHRDILGRDLLVRALDELIPPRLADMRGDNLPQVNKPELAKFLLAQGLSPEPERLPGQPLWSNHLLAAIQDQDRELVAALIQGGAEVDSGSFDGKTPLIHAVQNQDLELVKALIQGGASLDAPDHAGKTALIYATQNRDLELARALLEAGAKPNRSDLEDKTAMDYAQELGNRELVELLEGARP